MPSDNREWKQSGAGERVNRSISVVAASSILVPRKGKAPPFGKVVSVSFLLDTSSELSFENSFLDVLSSLFPTHLTSSLRNMVVLLLL